MTSRIPARRLYTAKERFALKPATNLLKRWRNTLSARRYAGQVPAGFEAVRAGLGDLHETPVLITIAFNMPWAIDLMARFFEKHLGIGKA